MLERMDVMLLGCGGYVVQKSSCHVDCNGIGGITVSWMKLLFSINSGFVKEGSAGKTESRRKNSYPGSHISTIYS